MYPYHIVLSEVNEYYMRTRMYSTEKRRNGREKGNGEWNTKGILEYWEEAAQKKRKADVANFSAVVTLFLLTM